MIKGYDGKKATPKQRAQDLLEHILGDNDGVVWYYLSTELEDDRMTERERELIKNQFTKLINRARKAAGI